MRAASRANATAGGRTAGSRLIRWATVGIVTMVGVTTSMVLASPAGAASTSPKILNFAPSVTQVSGAGGSVTLTAASISVPGGVATCTLSASPAVPGLPASNGCSTLSWTAALPGNASSKQVKYKFTLTVVGQEFPTTPGVAKTSVTSLVRTGAMYVAMGDSYSSGEGNPGPSATPWLDVNGVAQAGPGDGCDRSAQAYPVAVHSFLATQKLPSMGFRFVACSGALTPDIWNYAAPFGNTANGNEGLQDGWTADLANARVVTISIGGNDLNFTDILTNCLPGPHAYHTCDSSSNDGWIADLHANIATLQSSLEATYRHIETLAPNAALYVVGYPYLVPPQPSTIQQNLSCPAKMFGISSVGVGYLAYNEVALNNMIQTAAGNAGAHFVNLNSGSGSFIGHDVCSAKPYVNGVENTVTINGVQQTYSFHPNSTGQAAMAKLVDKAIKHSNAVTGIVPTSSGSGSAIAAGVGNTCALISGGTVDCWGINAVGELGNGTTTDSLTPVAVVGPSGVGTLTGVTAVSAGGDSTCALISGGTVDCWGSNGYGALGDGTTTDSTVPVSVQGPGGVGTLTGVTAVSAGYYDTCALLSGGTVDCWGNNYLGQLGNGTTTDSTVPVTVQGPGGVGTLTGVTAISAGYNSSCALISGGTVDCWGSNSEGELGNGTPHNSFTPVAVVGSGGVGTLTGVTAVAVGGVSTCALLSGGTVDCWGYNGSGELGNGTTTESLTPVAVVTPGGVGTLTGVTAVSAGYLDTCALISGGTVDCWGSNGHGDLGNGTTTDSLTPVAVVGPGGVGSLSGVTAVSAGYYNTCALISVGTVDCWGDNYWGQLGNGTTTDSSVPVLVSGP